MNIYPIRISTLFYHILIGYTITLLKKFFHHLEKVTISIQKKLELKRRKLMKLNYQSIGIRIRRLRKEQGLTQQTLAEISSQEPSNISHIERGATKLSLPTLVSIANALGVTTDELLCDNLSAAKTVFEHEITHILADCSHTEIKIITETMLALKNSLRQELH